MLDIIRHAKDSSGAAFMHYRGLGTFQVPAGIQAELNAASEAELFAKVEEAGMIDPFVFGEVCNRGLLGKYESWKAAQRNEAAPIGFGEAIIKQLLAE
jgi:hypothetical protein